MPSNASPVLALSPLAISTVHNLTPPSVLVGRGIEEETVWNFCQH